MKFKLQATEEMWSGTGRSPQQFTAEFSAMSLQEVCENFELFLRGCGYHIYNIDYDTELPATTGVRT